MCRIRWFWFKVEGNDGARWYQLKQTVPQDVVWGVHCFDALSHAHVNNMQLVDADTQMYKLPFDSCNAIIKDGDLVS